jgi:hypothetical protein
MLLDQERIVCGIGNWIADEGIERRCPKPYSILLSALSARTPDGIATWPNAPRQGGGHFQMPSRQGGGGTAARGSKKKKGKKKRRRKKDKGGVRKGRG